MGCAADPEVLTKKMDSQALPSPAQPHGIQNLWRVWPKSPHFNLPQVIVLLTPMSASQSQSLFRGGLRKYPTPSGQPPPTPCQSVLPPSPHRGLAGGVGTIGIVLHIGIPAQGSLQVVDALLSCRPWPWA